MEVDQPYHGANIDWNFPSPTATPTTSSFGHHVFNTPKPTPPSHFQDAFTTPQMPAYTTPQPAQYPSMTPIPRPQTAGDVVGQQNYHPYTQMWGQQQNNSGRLMAPPGQANPAFAMNSPPYSNMQQASMQLAMNASFGGGQMQTPPPTRGTSIKRVPQPPLIAFGTPSTIASRRFATPQQHVVPSNHNVLPSMPTPVQFPQLQFSPDLYNFTAAGPASAPILSNGRVFWDQSSSPSQPQQASTLDDPFAPQSTLWSNPIVRPSSSQALSFETPAMSSFPVMEPMVRPASAVTLPSTTGPSPTQNLAVGVDPSLLYSSPIRPVVVRSNSRLTKSKAQLAVLETRRKDSGFSAHHRDDIDTSSTPAPEDNAVAELKRSNTNGTAKPRSGLSSPLTTDSRSGSQNALLQNPPRIASPLKRSGRFPSDPPSDKKATPRPSVILTIDENGRARTETTRSEDTPTRSIRERYPGLFDSDSSDDESDSTEKTPSRAASFTFEKRDERRAKAAKLDPPVENLDGLDLPRSASAASIRRGVAPSKAAIAAASQLRRQGSLRKATPTRTTRPAPLGSVNSPLADVGQMEVSNSGPPFAVVPPTAPTVSVAAEWPTAFDDRTAFPGPLLRSFEAESELEEHNRRWSIMSFEQQQQHQPAPHPHPHSVSPQSFQQPLFPLQSSLAQPTSLQIRCLCGDATDRGMHLLQCHSCTQWVHAPCVGMNGNMLVPGFTCFLCTKPPARRFSGA